MGPTKIRLGICCINSKLYSPPMECFIKTIKNNYKDLEIILFDDDIIYTKNIEDWPICDCFLSFFSNGFPLEKAINYADLRNPVLINDLKSQQYLKDRRKVYQLLESVNIPLPKYLIINREKNNNNNNTSNNNNNELIETQDYIELNGNRIYKPFIEKPINAEDHNIYIYYSSSQGGGCRKLYRKIGNSSSDYDSTINSVRKDGSYIYEEFVKIDDAKDVKVYSTPSFSIAELRKSPSVDGCVERSKQGREKRISTSLSIKENEYSSKISKVFKQFICGYDILRVNGKSFVCDVNGWTMVKGDNKENFYENASESLYNFIISKLSDKNSNITCNKINSILEESSTSSIISSQNSVTITVSGGAGANNPNISIQFNDSPSSSSPPYLSPSNLILRGDNQFQQQLEI